MAREQSQPFIWVAVIAVLVVGTVVALQFVGSPPVSQDAETVTAVDTTPDASARPPRRPVTVRPAPSSTDASTPPDAAGSPPIPTSRGLAAFRDQALEDAQRLGSNAGDMEQLWKIGRFTGRTAEAAASLRSLIEKYGDTHRAACAVYMLQRMELMHGDAPLEERRQTAIRSLSALIDDDSDSRCDTGTRASEAAKFLLATQVYRHTDHDRSVRMLQETAGIEPDEVDNLGVPLAIRARTILKEVESAGP
ncbi:MAG: hypothetical protein ABIJ09_10640 [Pseudomonadota bacterium]